MPVSTSLITAKALSLWEDIQSKLPEEERAKTPFGASKGWFDRFRKRAGLHNIQTTGESASADRPAALFTFMWSSACVFPSPLSLHSYIHFSLGVGLFPRLFSTSHSTSLRSQLSALGVHTFELPTLLAASGVHPLRQPAAIHRTCAIPRMTGQLTLVIPAQGNTNNKIVQQLKSILSLNLLQYTKMHSHFVYAAMEVQVRGLASCNWFA